MRVVIRSVCWVLAVTAVAVVAVAWSSTRPTLDAADAADVAVRALDSAGFAAVVTDPPIAGRHETHDGQVLDVWIVDATVRDGEQRATIELRVQKSAGHVVYVDDRIGPHQQDQLLSAEQFERLGRYEDDTYADRWALQNGLGSASAIFVVVVSVVLSRRTDTLWRPT